jgi:hypothetical protein
MQCAVDIKVDQPLLCLCERSETPDRCEERKRGLPRHVLYC